MNTKSNSEFRIAPVLLSPRIPTTTQSSTGSRRNPTNGDNHEILQNAIDSIEIGLEDYKNSDSRRLASSVRNFYAGILLLFKHKLSLLSDGDDEALLKSNVLPEIVDGDVRWVGKGHKTVAVQQIQERFKSLGVQVSWERMRV